MNDDGIFRSEHTHEVGMPEGSHVAVSKTAQETEPSIRKVFQEDEEFIDTHMIIEEGGGSQVRTAYESVAVAIDVTEHLGPATQTDRIDNQKAEATLTREPSLIPSFNNPDEVKKPESSKETSISTETPTKNVTSADTKEIRSVSDASTFLVEMDFPARVINLKIENDQLRERLDLLEQRITP